MRQNVDPALWGPSAWKFLDYCAKACDPGSAQSYKKWIELLPEVLPCEQCREHSAAYIASHPVDTSDLNGWIKKFQSAVSHRKAQESPQRQQQPPCAKRRMFLVVVGVLTVALALVLLIVGLSKLMSGSTENNETS